MLSYQMEKDTIDGKKTIIQNPTEKQRQEHENVSRSMILSIKKYFLNSASSPSTRCTPLTCSSQPAMANHVTWTSAPPSTNASPIRCINSKWRHHEVIKVEVRNKSTNLTPAVFSEVEKKFDTMCFNLRALADEKKAKMGINECVNHGLITPFPVLVSFITFGMWVNSPPWVVADRQQFF